MNRIETASTTMMRTKILAPSSSMRSSLLWRGADCGMVFGCGQGLRHADSAGIMSQSRRLSPAWERTAGNDKGALGRDDRLPAQSVRMPFCRSDLAVSERNAGKQAEGEQPADQ